MPKWKEGSTEFTVGVAPFNIGFFLFCFTFFLEEICARSEPRAGFDPATYCLQVRAEQDRFRAWLEAQYSHEHSRAMFTLAMKYQQAVGDPKEAAKLKTLTRDMRRYVMQSLAALSKYSGNYETWQSVRRQAGLKWESKPAVSIIRSLLSGEADQSYIWLKETLPQLPREARVELVWIAVSGLRPVEASRSHELLFRLSSEKKLEQYLDLETSMLCHYKFPALFIRRTKNAFITFASPRMVEVLASSSPTSYNAVWCMIKRRQIEVRTYGLRKYYGTMLKKSLDREMIDLLQGRLDASVFVKHYYRPLIVELRDKVLSATKPLEDELLAFLD